MSFLAVLLGGIPTTISAGMQIRCQAPSFSLAINMSNRFAMQNCQVYFLTLVCQRRSTRTRKSAQRHVLRSLSESSQPVFDCNSDSCCSFLPRCHLQRVAIIAHLRLHAERLKFPPPLGRTQLSASSWQGESGGGGGGRVRGRLGEAGQGGAGGAAVGKYISPRSVGKICC